MSKKPQRRYNSEAQIITAIDRLRDLEARDIAQIAEYNAEIVKLRPFPEELSTINHKKAMIDLLEARIKGRGGRLERLKQKLAEFRTSMLFDLHCNKCGGVLDASFPR